MKEYNGFYDNCTDTHHCYPKPDCNDNCHKCKKPKQFCVCQHQNQGDLSAVQGDQTQSQGEQEQSQGDLTETLGDQTQSQGEQAQSQGDLTETLGDQTQSQGEQAQSQGDLTETLGDLCQSQGGESQGDQTQSITGHEGQTQGEQIQGDQTHGDQTQGDQTLSSSPTISTPVNVSGVNVNVQVSCCDEAKKHHHDCKKECRDSIYSLLSLIGTLTQSISDPESSQIVVYYSGIPESSLDGNLNKVSDCTFTIIPSSEGNERTFLIDSLEALSLAAVEETPNIFSLLLSYLQSSYDSNYLKEDCNKDQNCCSRKIALQLQAYYNTELNIEIFLSNTSFTGFIYKINKDIVYLVDDLDEISVIYAIPICKILSYQAIDTPL